MIYSFTTDLGKISNKLTNQATLISGTEDMIANVALWDTGATTSCISTDVVDRLNLKTIGQKFVRTPAGQRILNTYLLDVRLPNNVLVKDVMVIGTEIGNHGIDLLIGMDIIGLGDFSVSNFEGKTRFSFRIPSCEHADFAQ